MNYKLVILTAFYFIGRALCNVNCPSFTNCQDCSAQKYDCGWCASDADGGGSCIQMSNSGKPVTPCPSGYWNYACCSGHTSCDDCSNYDGCKWCESGSSVNGNKCIPYNGILAPQLGGCDDPYYTNKCCDDYSTCDTCSGSHRDCKWCQKGSTVNGGRCVPYDGSENPLWGGCDSGYYSNYCCDDYSTCDECSAAAAADWNLQCKWCQTGSKVNGGKCLPYGGSENPLWGGCDSGYYSNYCCDDYSTCDECSAAAAANPNLQCKWCQTGSSVNGGKCLPYGGSENPLWGGCDSDYYTNWCCQDMQTCADCIAKGWDCRWCGAASTVNPSECLPYHGSYSPMYGGCDDGNFTDKCPNQAFISF